jgi:hypothetical protein
VCACVCACIGVLEHSFYAFRYARAVQPIRAQISVLQQQRAETVGAHGTSDAYNLGLSYFSIQSELQNTHVRLVKAMQTSPHMLRFLQPGRVVHLCAAAADPGTESQGAFGWAVVLGFRRLFVGPTEFEVQVLLPCVEDAKTGRLCPHPAAHDPLSTTPLRESDVRIINVDFSMIDAVAAARMLIDGSPLQNDRQVCVCVCVCVCVVCLCE